MTELPQQFRDKASGAAQNAAPARDERRKRPSETYTPPFSIRLSFEERAKLEAAAAGQRSGRFIPETAVGSERQPRRRRGKETPSESFRLQVLGTRVVPQAVEQT
jgi:hypothetical protein